MHCNDKKPISILVDNCVNGMSDTMQGAVKEQHVQWGDTIQIVSIAGFQRKPMPSPDQGWKIQQIKSIPTIGRLARDGVLNLYTYSELRNESWKRPGGFPAIGMGDLFEGVAFQTVDAAVECSFFFQMEFGEYLKKDRVIEFCNWLLSPGIEALAERLAPQERFPGFLINNMKKVQRFRDLCSGLSEKQYPDAFHFWTAEVNEMAYFLTTDKKFIHAMTKTKKMDLPCVPISPSDLLKYLDINELDPLPFELDRFINFSGQAE